MKETRRKFSSAFKAEVALEAIKGVKTITELAQEYQVHPVQVNTWKKTFLERTANIFEGDKKQEQELKRLREDRDELYLEDPTRGTRRMSKELKKLGYQCGRHHTRTLMQRMRLKTVYCRPRTTIIDKTSYKYPYLRPCNRQCFHRAILAYY